MDESPRPVTTRLQQIEAEFAARKDRSSYGGDGREKAIARQHDKGNLTAMERMGLLFDEDTFQRLFTLRGPGNSGDGVVAGWGYINGRKVYAYAWDFTQIAGTCSADNGKAIAEIIESARKECCPIIGLNDSGGARIQVGVASLFGYGHIFNGHIDSSGHIPQISAIVGPCAGGAVYAPALTDFILMAKNAFMAVTGPGVLKSTTGKDLTMDELGGCQIHSEHSGRVNRVGRDDREIIKLIRELLGYLPGSCLELPPYQKPNDPLDRPCDLSREKMETALEEDVPFDIRVTINDLLDDQRYFEMCPKFAPNLITCFGRLGGWPVGIIANQGTHLSGNLDPDSAKKGARFIRFCDCFNIPIITLVDVAGFIPDDEAERRDLEGFGAQLLMAYRLATVPKFSLVLRRAFGEAFYMMGGKLCGANRTFAWPCSRFAVMDASVVVDLTNQHETEIVNPWKAAELGYIDQFIAIKDTRLLLAEALLPLMEAEKLKPHGFKQPNRPI